MNEDDGNFADEPRRADSVTCDLCGGRMYRTGGCYFCVKCGQKKCNTDIT